MSHVLQLFTEVKKQKLVFCIAHVLVWCLQLHSIKWRKYIWRSIVKRFSNMERWKIVLLLYWNQGNLTRWKPCKGLPGCIKAVVGSHSVVSEQFPSVSTIRAGIWHITTMRSVLISHHWQYMKMRYFKQLFRQSNETHTETHTFVSVMIEKHITFSFFISFP